jgi:hypothetical protein
MATGLDSLKPGMEYQSNSFGKHITNALREELRSFSVVANFATTAIDGKIYQVEYFNLDMIISIGYRVKSQRGIQFRIWANKVLKDYILKGYVHFPLILTTTFRLKVTTRFPL